MAIGLSVRGRTAACNAITALVNTGSLNANGYINIYTAPRPDSSEGVIGSAVRLVTIPLSNPAFASAADGVATAIGLSSTGVVIDASGTPSWFRVFDRDNNPVWDGSVTLTDNGGDMQLNDLTFVNGGKIVITAFRAVMPQ
jgi:hypothetical protein